MFGSRPLRGLTVLSALLLITMSSTAVGAQSSPLSVAQSSDGTLYLEQGSNVWNIVPNPISDEGLAALTPSGELDGAIPAAFLGAPGAPTVLQVVQGSDGSFYIAQGSNVWTLVPHQISDSDLAALTPVGEVDGTIAAPALNTPAGPAAAPSASQGTIPAEPTPTATAATPSNAILPVPSSPQASGGKILMLLLPGPVTGSAGHLTDRYDTLDIPEFQAELKRICSDCEAGYGMSNGVDNGPLENDAVQGIIQNAKVFVIDPANAGDSAKIVDEVKFARDTFNPNTPPRRRNVWVIAYERLITGSADVDYYIGLNNRGGALQGQALNEAIKAMADDAAILAFDLATDRAVPDSATGGKTTNNGVKDVPTILVPPG